MIATEAGYMMNESPRLPTPQKEKGHILTARDREQITVSGVTEVVSFDETNVRLVTVCGILNLEGEGLRIHVLNTADGAVAVTGKLCGVLYEDPDAPDRTPKARSRRFFGL
jgi:sporulation protein YabP